MFNDLFVRYENNIVKFSDRKTLYGLLLKAERKNQPSSLGIRNKHLLVNGMLYLNEYDVIISNLHKMVGIQFFVDDVVQLVFQSERDIRPYPISFMSEDKTLIETLKTI